MTREFFDMKMAEMDIVFDTTVDQSIKDAIFNALRQEFGDKDFDTACRGVTLGETSPPNSLTFLEYAPGKSNATQIG